MSTSILNKVKDTRPRENELHKLTKESPDKEVIHSQPVGEVAMETAGGRHAQRRWKQKSISAGERKKTSAVKERR